MSDQIKSIAPFTSSSQPKSPATVSIPKGTVGYVNYKICIRSGGQDSSVGSPGATIECIAKSGSSRFLIDSIFFLN